MIDNYDEIYILKAMFPLIEIVYISKTKRESDKDSRFVLSSFFKEILCILRIIQ